MKKVLFLATGIFSIAGMAYGQSGSNNTVPLQKLSTKGATNIEFFGNGGNTAPVGQTLNRAFPDTIWMEDFGGGTSSSSWVPTGWANNGINDPQALWEYRGTGTTPSNTTGSRGGCMTAATILTSPTAANGFFIFDSNFLDDPSGTCAGALGTGVAPSPHEGHLVSETIDLTGYPFVTLVFNYYIRDFQGDQHVDISIDGGTTWTQVWEAGLGANDESSLSAQAQVNLTSFGAGNAANFKMRFVFNGDYYVWMVDDVMLAVPPANDLVNAEGSYHFDDYWYQYFNGPDSANSKPAQLPLVQFAGLGGAFNFFSDAVNVGTQTQTGVTGDVDVTRNGVSVYTGSTTPVSVLANTDTTRMKHTATWMPTQTGLYRFSFNVNQTETDENPADNMAYDSIRVTDTVMAREFISASGDIVASLNDNRVEADNAGSDYFKIANYFEIPVADTVTSISFWIVGTHSEAGKLIGVNVLDRNRTGAFSVTHPEGIEYTLTAADVASNQLITISLEDVPLQYRILTDTIYFACVYIVDNDPFGGAGTTTGRDLGIGCGEESYEFATFLYLPSDPDGAAWFFTDVTAGIRMNFGPLDPTSGIENADNNFGMSISPNPASSVANINFTMKESADVMLTVTDVTGKQITSVSLGQRFEGVNTYALNVDNYASGVYMYTLTSNGVSATRRMVVSK